MSTTLGNRKSPRGKLKDLTESPQRPKTPSSPLGSPSEAVCAICLGRHENKCFTNICMHEFCFNCLLEWSKVKAECPLCKQPFGSIIHNIKSNSEYDVHKVDVLQPQEPEFSPFGLQRFRYRTTLTPERRDFVELQRRYRELRGMFIEEGILPPGVPSRPRSRLTGTSSFRRQRYARDLWVRPLADVTNRFRDSTPEFFRHNPAGTQRLMPWLNRELNVLLPRRHANRLPYVMNLILRLLPSYHMCSRSFREAVEPYVGANTEHFVHEMYTFARSPYDMAGFDENAVYEPRSAYQVEEVAVSESSSEDEALVRLMSDIPLPPRSPQPGPSGVGRPQRLVDDGQSYTASSSTRPTDEDDDEDIEIVEVVGPRPPEVITLVSESEHEPNDADQVQVQEEASSSSAARGKSLVKSSSPAAGRRHETSRKDKRLKSMTNNRDKNKKRRRREQSPSSSESSDREAPTRNSNDGRRNKRRAPPPPPAPKPRRYWDMDPEDLPNHRPTKRAHERSQQNRNKS